MQQQSDFFLSLGQHDQAIAVLREHIAANPGTSALAYLDLLRIYHSLGREEDYTRLAEEFERAFNADVPYSTNSPTRGRGLEHYRSALARIESQWPAPGTLALIEELVFRKPGVHEDGAFDLAAYQELLLLYALAKEVIDPDNAPPAPVTPHAFVDTLGTRGSRRRLRRSDPETEPPAMNDGPVPAAVDLRVDRRRPAPRHGAGPGCTADAAGGSRDSGAAGRETSARNGSRRIRQDGLRDLADADRAGQAAAGALDRSSRDRFRIVRPEHRGGDRPAHRSSAERRRAALSSVRRPR